MSIKKLSTLFLIFLIISTFEGVIQAQTFNKKALLEFAKNENRRHKLSVHRIPLVYEPANLTAAQAINNNQIWSGGISGLSLSGNSQIIGFWDENQPLLTHQEYNGRVSFEDSESGTNNDHATNMVGTIIATGVDADARGMANLAQVEAWNWNNDIAEMATEAANGLLTSSHPYTEISGWTNNSSSCGDDPEWTWYSLESENSSKAYQFGYYDAQAQKWDSVAYLAPDYLIVKAAGNGRGEGPSSQPLKHWTLDDSFNCVLDSTSVRELDGGSLGFESISAASLAKNVLVVGAVESSSNNFEDLSSISPQSSSGFGPTDDGRIKPDIMAPTNVYTSSVSANNAYSTGGGTSAASAVVTGSVALIREHYQNLYSDTLSSASIRGLLAHTADDIGNEGPDYQNGWGLMNTERAVRFLSANQSSSTSTIFKDSILTTGNTITIDFNHTSTRPILVTIAWTDPAGTPIESADDPTDTLLVNDIDLSVTSPSSTNFLPWVLDRSNPSTLASNGDNDVDNIEQILIKNTEAGNYSISINHEGNLQSGSQKVSIFISDAEPEIIFESIADGNWSDASTWEGGVAPSTSLHRAQLNHSVKLDINAILRGVSFEGSSAELDLNSKRLSLYGGIYQNDGGIGFAGDTSSSISLLDWDITSDELSFKSSKQALKELIVNVEGDTIKLGSDLSIYSHLSLQKGAIDVQSNQLILVSDGNSTAWLQKESGKLIGDITYSRLFVQASSGWRVISSPVKEEYFSTLSDSFHTQGGVWADYSVAESASNLWLYNKTSQSLYGYVGNDSTFSSGEGYLMYMFEDAIGGTPLPTFLNFTGEEPDSVISNMERGVDDASSYNLAGNPYSGSIDWHELVSDGTNIGTSYATWNPSGVTAGGTSGYVYYNSSGSIGDAGRYIAPMQGFFVQATDDDAKLRFRQSHKSGEKPNSFGKIESASQQYIRVELMDENQKVLDNQAHLIFNELATNSSDEYDVLRIETLNSVNNQLSFIGLDNEIRVFESRSSLVEEDIIPLKLELSEPNNYELNWRDWNNIPEDWVLELVDTKKNKIIDMIAHFEYQFYEDNAQSDRFMIRVQRRGLTLVEEPVKPTEYNLFQNYPNPFNPSTTINYNLKNASKVRLAIYNTLGQQVALIVDEQQHAGSHSIQFNASELSSGVYFYRIEANDFLQIRSMILIK